MGTYTVQAGDDFDSIASRFSTTVSRLRQLNPGVDGDRLSSGQVINVPGSATSSKCNRYQSMSSSQTCRSSRY